MLKPARQRLAERIDTIEGAYEFFLAYAAQGLTREAEGSRVEAQLRAHLDAMGEAVADLEELLAATIDGEPGAPREALEPFRAVLGADASRAAAVLELVRAQPFASSQLVDNLNASIHVRTLLTDLFVLDEVLELGVEGASRTADPEVPEEKSVS